jgi:dTDP-4-amino-4,6-dideoxygalactose transaminase
MNEKRRAIARQYGTAFADIDVVCPPPASESNVVHLYVIRVKARAALARQLSERGIATDVHYPVPDHLQRGYRCVQRAGDLPVSEALCAEVLSLPCYPGMSPAQVERVLQAVRESVEPEAGSC